MNVSEETTGMFQLPILLFFTVTVIVLTTTTWTTLILKKKPKCYDYEAKFEVLYDYSVDLWLLIISGDTDINENSESD